MCVLLLLAVQLFSLCSVRPLCPLSKAAFKNEAALAITIQLWLHDIRRRRAVHSLSTRANMSEPHVFPGQVVAIDMPAA